MKLKCRIHGQDYDIVAGATFSEEYNETLDSGSIIIDQIPKFDLKPYDDVFIWKADEEFNGYCNEGDKILASTIGATMTDQSYLYYIDNEGSPYEVGDPYIFNNMICDEYGYGFKSYYFDRQNKVYPGLIDIWASNFLYDLNGDSEIKKWNVPNVVFRLHIHNDDTGLDGVACYALPNERTNNYINERFLVLTKVNGSENSQGMPDTLYVESTINVPSIFRYTMNEDVYTLRLSTIALTSLDPEAEDNVFVIDSINKPVDLAYYAYDYNYDIGYAHQEIEPETKLIFNFLGFGSSESMLSISSLKLKVVVRGYVFDAICEKPVQTGPFNIKFHFKLLGENLQENDGFDINVSQSAASVWNAMNQSFTVTLLGTQYYVDKIIDNGYEDVVIAIDSSRATDTYPTFYKHLLVDKRRWEKINLNGNLYKCTIDLMSETKRLEKKVLPNISITQPIVGQKRSVWYYLNQFVDLYSPKVKVKLKDNTWVYRNKYHIDARTSNEDLTHGEYVKTPVHKIFTDDIYAPEMSLSAPTLRELLSRLMVVKDCIPVVKDDVIYAMKISDIHGEFKIDENKFSFFTDSMASDNYSTAFRREYGDAISQKNSAHLVEFMGFRTSSNGDGLMTLDNMILQTRFPIYKINKLLMCYYLKVPVDKKLSNGNTRTYNKLILVKQDITKLVLQNTVRNALAADWTVISHGGWENITYEQMAQYRVFTLGYDIGSNVISGWGEKVSYLADPLGWTKETYTYIELIMNLRNMQNSFGENHLQFLEPGETLHGAVSVDWKTAMVTPNNSGNVTDALKGLFFQMDYIAMYSGAIIHSKENTEDDDFETPDNCSTPLSILEVDGLFEKEKANRLANPEIAMIARFDTVTEMNNSSHNNIVGTEYTNEAGETAIIYHREYQIFDDCVLANFLGSHDYVLKNYFTSVFAKYRTYSYAGYDECVNRAENDRYLIVLSDDRCYYENTNDGLVSYVIPNVLSAFSESVIEDDLNIYFDKQINGGYFSFINEQGEIKKYYSDVNQFVSGYSLCFNIKMFDNITAGNYVANMNCFDKDHNNSSNNVYVGSQLGWYETPISQNDGFLKTVGCFIGHFETEDFYKDAIDFDSSATATLYSRIFDLPLVNREPTFVIGKEYDYCKDNKELIDYTLQYEVVNQDEDVVVSEWLIKLTDYNNYVKFSTEKQIGNVEERGHTFEVKFYSYHTGNTWGMWLVGIHYNGNSPYQYGQGIVINIADEDLSYIQEGATLSGAIPPVAYSGSGSRRVAEGIYQFFDAIMIPQLNTITSVTKDENDNIVSFSVKGSMTVKSHYSVSLETGNDVTYSSFEIVFNRENSGTQGTSKFVFKGYIANENQISFGLDERLFISDAMGEDNAKTATAAFVLNILPYMFPKTMYAMVSNKTLEPSLVYAQYKLNELPDSLRVVQTSPIGEGDGNTFEDIFKLVTDEQGRICIKYHEAPTVRESNPYYRINSVQYWYYDVNGDGYLHFVCGVNVNNDANLESARETDKNIYVSTVKNRKPIVYDEMHRECGTIMNFAEQENASSYGEQLFVPFETEEETEGDD